MTEELKQCISFCEKNFVPLTQEQLNWKIDNNKWSILQCIEHINKTNGAYRKIFQDLIDIGYHPGLWTRINPLTAFTGRKILQFVEETPTRKLPAPANLLPSSSMLDASVLRTFCQETSTLIKILDQLKPMNTRQMKIASPLSFLVTLRVSDAIKLLQQHTKRHINQAYNVKLHRLFPK
jgi:hypothetical protein